MINIKIGIRFHPSRHSFLSSTPQREDPKQLGGMGVLQGSPRERGVGEFTMGRWRGSHRGDRR